MRRILPLLALVATASLGLAQSVATKPVGFSTLTVPTGTTGAIGLPFDNPATFTGAITSFGSNTITTTSANFPTLTPPYVVRILSGASAGRQFLVASNTTDTITTTTNLTSVAAGDSYTVFPSQTLLSFFGAGAPALSHTTAGQTDSTLVDNVLIRGSAGWLTYYYDDVVGHWQRQAGGTTNRDNIALLPDQGFLLVRRAGTDLTLTLLGAVPISNLKTDLPAGKTTALPNRFPVATTLSALGLQSLPGWVKDPSSANPNPAADDVVLIRGSAGWLTYFYANDTGHWQRQAGGTTNRDATPIPLGSSVLITRVAGTDVTLDQALPYTLN